MVRRVISGANKRFIVFVSAHASLLRFIFTGLINTGCDLILYSIFANILSIPPIVASIISTSITLVLSFFLNNHFVFKSGKQYRETAILFVVFTLFNVWVVQSLCLFLALQVLQTIPFFTSHVWTANITAKLCGVAVSTVLNYLSYRKIFKE